MYPHLHIRVESKSWEWVLIIYFLLQTERHFMVQTQLNSIVLIDVSGLKTETMTHNFVMNMDQNPQHAEHNMPYFQS